MLCLIILERNYVESKQKKEEEKEKENDEGGDGT